MTQRTFSKILVQEYDKSLPTVVFDLDDTLGDMHVLIMEHVNETYGLSEVSERWQNDFSFAELAKTCGVSTDHFYETLKNDLRPVEKFKLNSLAPSFIAQVRKQFEIETGSDINVHIITSRGNFWLDHSQLIIDEVKDLDIEGIHVIDSSTCKALWAKEKFNTVAIFEDSPRHIDACIEHGIPVFVSTMNYNQHYNQPRFCLRENDFGCFA